MAPDPHFHLQLLGRFELRRSTPSPEVIAISSKKARALLAYVAMQQPMRASRERLADLLWPERVDRQARQNLRKCIAALRHDAAGRADGLLAIDGEAIAIAAGLTVDALRLRELSEGDDSSALRQAAELYRGPFLAGLELDSEPFCDWIAVERAALESAAGEVLAQLASEADQAGDAKAALRFSSRLTALDPLREDWQRVSLRISVRHAGRDKALVAAKTFITLLRKELDVAPEPETAALIEQIKAGQIVPVRTREPPPCGSIEPPLPAGAANDQAAMPPHAVAASRVDARPGWAWATAGAAAAAMMAVLVLVLGPGGGSEAPMPAPIATATDPSTIPLLVTPFRAAEAESGARAEALTEDVLANVSRFSGLTVFDGRSGQRRAANVRFATWGSVRRQGTDVRITVGLNDTTNNALLWAGEFAERADGTANLDTAVPRRIARDLQVQTVYAQARDVDATEPRRAALPALLAKAVTAQYLGLARNADVRTATLYEEALRRDPNCVLALIGLAADVVTSGTNLLNDRKSGLARAEQLLRRALQINPRVERAYYWLGKIQLVSGRRQEALQSFNRALEINPSFVPAEANAGYALVLSGRAREGLGRIENALNAGAHDPNERIWLRFAGIAQLDLGNDKEAIDSLLAAASLAVPAPPLHAALASAYALTGQRISSQAEFRLVKEMADPAALTDLLDTASRHRDTSRYLQGLQLAAADTL